jgi:NADPH:quinone reductase-like Zn-dependent oxidoreductase
VTDLDVGDDVFGTSFMHGFGAFAERVAMPEHLVVRKPAGISADAAAATPLAALTALQALRDHGRLQASQRVLVIGASGGVGTFAVQIANALGADVTGVCSTRNVDLVRSHGADHVIDHTVPGVWDDLDPFDLVLQLGGTLTASAGRRLLERHGTLIQLSGDSDNRWFGPFGRIIAGRILSRFVSQTITTFTVSPNKNDLQHLAGLLETGAVRPVIDTTVTFDHVAEAIRHLEAGHTRGKVVLHTMDTAADVRTSPGAERTSRSRTTAGPDLA